ncbi:hypothetical protein MNB_SM-7-1501 [hydrothermal vent metagenome]|uniref:Uncharacterized protein n=1 Tax=hydrothermal vent metagenome TaxID=652676 RepID=A0A1W1B9C7_9ZZZZ
MFLLENFFAYLSSTTTVEDFLFYLFCILFKFLFKMLV